MYQRKWQTRRSTEAESEKGPAKLLFKQSLQEILMQCKVLKQLHCGFPKRMRNAHGFNVESDVIKEFSKITRLKSKTVPDHSRR